MKIYKSYLFRNKDPIIDQLRTAIADAGASYAEIERHSGVTYATMRNWFHGETKKPQFATCKAVARAIGYEIQLVKTKETNVVPIRKRA